MSIPTDKSSPESSTNEPDRTTALSEREWAKRHLEKKNKLWNDLAAYILINLFLIGIWAVSGLGYFWPGWVLGGWGVLLALDAWHVYHQRPITEEDIDRELRNRR